MQEASWSCLVSYTSPKRFKSQITTFKFWICNQNKFVLYLKTHSLKSLYRYRALGSRRFIEKQQSISIWEFPAPQPQPIADCLLQRSGEGTGKHSSTWVKVPLSSQFCYFESLCSLWAGKTTWIKHPRNVRSLRGRSLRTVSRSCREFLGEQLTTYQNETIQSWFESANGWWIKAFVLARFTLLFSTWPLLRTFDRNQLWFGNILTNKISIIGILKDVEEQFTGKWTYLLFIISCQTCMTFYSPAEHKRQYFEERW